MAERSYSFPFHEVFKGTMLAQWRYYKEQRADCINLFDSRLGSVRLRLLRFMLLKFLVGRAQREDTVEVAVRECVERCSRIGASEGQVLEILRFFAQHRLIKTVSAEDVGRASTVIARKSGGYYCKVLSGRFNYVEECMFDTAIDEDSAWSSLSALSEAVARENRVDLRMELRVRRLITFLDYLRWVEEKCAESAEASIADLEVVEPVRAAAVAEAELAVEKAKRHYET